MEMYFSFIVFPTGKMYFMIHGFPRGRLSSTIRLIIHIAHVHFFDIFITLQKLCSIHAYKSRDRPLARKKLRTTVLLSQINLLYLLYYDMTNINDYSPKCRLIEQSII